MTEGTVASDRRPVNVAILGFLLQLGCFGTLVALATWSRSDAIWTASRFMLIGLPIWLVLFLFFKQLRRVNVEALETEELRRSQAEGGVEAIFELDDEALLIEQNRLRWIVRWLFPAASLVLAALLVGGHFVGWSWDFESAFQTDGIGALHRTQEPTLVMWFFVGVGFLCFLYARYGLALSRLPQWRLLRAGAICMAGNALVCLSLAIVLMASSTISWAEPLLAYLLRLGLLLLGLEFLANFILDYYRPRSPDVIARPSFESRALGLVSEPGSLAKSIAEAINYQFGFEVSSTWFYQFLQRWLFPIMVATCVVVLALTSVVLVNAEEKAVVERFGRLRPQGAVLGPGLHFKWPYPIEIVYRAPAKKVSELVIGESLPNEKDDQGAILWTKSHEYIPELLLLVGSPPAEEGEVRTEEVGASEAASGTRSVPVHLLLVSVPIEYRIKDIEAYLYNQLDPQLLLENLAYQHITKFAASIDADQLMGPSRDEFNKLLHQQIQESLDALDAGIEIVFVGIRGAHPPAKQEVAKAYQASISAETAKGSMIHAAEAEERRILTSAAGSIVRARELDGAIQTLNRLRSTEKAGSEALSGAERTVTDLLMGAPEEDIPPPSGQVAQIVADARADASRAISDAASKVRLFNAEVAAYEAAPALYLQRRQLEALEELDLIRKYVIIGDTSNLIIEHDTAEQGALDRVLEEGVGK
ncbi:MAG: hypothetical protein J5J06_00870 [Phycisphaerae bacterium]|nr:hypothetical protein [Phycisphaerae bacterium]